MKIIKHMQSCFLLETKGARILIDPGTYVFNEEGLKPSDFSNIDTLIFTHEHFDHFDLENVIKIVEQCNPKIIATAAVIDIIKQSHPNFNYAELKDGSIERLNGISIEGFQSQHGPLPNGKTAPNVVGAVIDDGESRFYTPGDSLILNPLARADIIAVPICGTVVMDIPIAKQELLKVMPKLAIPDHYDNLKYPTNIDDFVGAMKGADIEIKVLNPGEELIFGSL